ncbi:MAG: adenine phosphoribosyltransferase [Candidatus Bipolaricaulota bacterium]|nr:MAG: adenine phosphoribosyltransferase [Candidatus Bipolaricaulota bacterium]
MSEPDLLRAAIRDVPDFPKAGVLFKDITPLLKDPAALREALRRMEERWRDESVDAVAGIEARGFIFGGALADRLGIPFVPLRKQGKLPWHVARAEYALEYGTDAIEMHVDAIEAGQRVLIVDDLLATGGTARAAAELIEAQGGVVAGFSFVVSLVFLKGGEKISGYPVQSLVEYGE